MSAGPIERLRAMVDAERLRAGAATTILEGLNAEGVRELAGALELLAEALECAVENVESYTYAEGREEKADAKDAALDAIEQVCQAAEYGVGEADLPDWLIAELTTKRLAGTEGAL